MADTVSSILREPPHFQINEPSAPCSGHSTCTDCTIASIVLHERGGYVSAHGVRRAAAPDKDPCRGLNPTEALRGLYNLGVRGYSIVVNPTAAEAIRATDHGIVLLAVGYNGYPVPSEAEAGGKTDVQFRGPHAISLRGRRNWQTKPAKWPSGVTFHPGWRVWTRDPDHHWGDRAPLYDRFRSSLLVRAMDALIGNEGWQVRLMIAKGGRPPITRAHMAMAPAHQIEPASGLTADDLFPDFGVGQSGGPA